MSFDNEADPMADMNGSMSGEPQPVPAEPPRPVRDRVSTVASALPIHQPVVVGSPGRLTPFPVGRPLPLPGGIARPADSVVEWIDVGRLQVRGVSVRGHMHRYEGIVRQDSIGVGGPEGWLVCAVADGLGSQPFSHIGAARAVEYVLQSAPTIAEVVAARDGDLVLCSEIADQVARPGEWAPGVVTSVDQLSTTLTFAAMTLASTEPGEDGTLEVSIAQVGDSHAFLLEAGLLRNLTNEEPGDGLASSAVAPLPGVRVARVTKVVLRPGEVLLLTTDGVGNLLDDVPAYRDMLVGAFTEAAPMPGPLMAMIDATVKSYDDDRSLVAIRLKEI